MSLPDLVIVTGAGRGIGRQIALKLGSRGVSVLCISRTPSADSTAAAIRQEGGKAEGLQIDLGDFQVAQDHLQAWLSKKEVRRVGAVLAAGSLGPSGALIDTALSEWDLTWRTNVLGNLAVAKAVLPTMIKRRFGRLLFFAGGGSAYAYPLFPAYAASKTALVRAVENLHEDTKNAGDFAVSILAPGAVDTDMLSKVRAQGGEVKTVVSIEEPVKFSMNFMSAKRCAFSGCFVHVRDEWQKYLEGEETMPTDNLWKLRRTE